MPSEAELENQVHEALNEFIKEAAKYEHFDTTEPRCSQAMLDMYVELANGRPSSKQLFKDINGNPYLIVVCYDKTLDREVYWVVGETGSATRVSFGEPS